MVIVPANYLKQAALGDAPAAVNVAVTALLAAVLAVVITYAYRMAARSKMND